MPRTKAEIISDMVDAGFSDDEIRKSFKPKESSSLVGKAWNALAVPEQVVAKTIPKLTDLQGKIQNTIATKTGLPIQEEPTGNLLRDVAAGTPRIIGEIGEKIVPPMVSRGSLLTMGALEGVGLAKPVLKAIGGGAAKALESISGLEYKTPGILKEAAKDSNVIRAAGREKIAPMYEAAKKIGGDVRETLSEIPEKIKLVKASLKLAKTGELNPTEAFEARKQLSDIKDSVSDQFFRKSTEKLNEIAKPVFKEADAAFRKGVRADELRRIFPVNKSGGTSIAKSVLGSIAGLVPTIAMSPLAQGAAATGIGMAARTAAPLINNPALAAPIVAAAKVLTREKAIDFYKKALKKVGGNEKKARVVANQDAIDKGYNTDKIVDE